MEIIGFLCAILIGLSLGMIGGGGSILTLPVLVYLFGVNPVLATAYSLFVVGITSLFGALGKLRHGLVDIKTTIVFAVPSFISVYLTRLFLVPAIPSVVFPETAFSVNKDFLIMAFFSVIMLFAAVSMIRSNGREQTFDEKQKFNYPGIIIDGIVVGLFDRNSRRWWRIFNSSGPCDIGKTSNEDLQSELPCRLLRSNHLLGFVGDIQVGQNIDWRFLLLFSGLAVVGIFVGNYVSKFLSDRKLKRIFGWFVLVMGIYILFNELIIR